MLGFGLDVKSDALLALEDKVFEHLVFDLMLLAGLRNVRWRTPGADGGRDIQGELLRLDFAGESLLENWYVECKRYAASLAWPLVRDKIAFAENHQADYLLVCTTSTLSPTCRDEVARWNQRGSRPLVRSWDGASLANQIELQPCLRDKYSLGPPRSAPAASDLPALVDQAHRATLAAAGRAAFKGQDNPALEHAAALLELTKESVRQAGPRPPIKTFSADVDGYAWLICDPGTGARLPAAGVRAVATLLRVVTRSSKIAARNGPADTMLLTPERGPSRSLSALLNPILVASDLQAQESQGTLVLSSKEPAP